MTEPALLALAGLVILGASFVQGVTGFGHALVAIGLLTLLMGAKEAVLVLALLAPVIAVVVFVRVRREVDWRETLWLGVPLAAIGMPAGILLFKWISGDLLRPIVGVLLVVFAVYFLSPFAPKPRRVHRAWTVLAGTASGLLGGLASTGGPPLALYVYSLRMDKVRRLAVLQAVFVLSSVVKVLMLLPAHVLTARTWGRSAILAVPMAAGVTIGHTLFRRIPAEPLRIGVLIFLLGIGVVLAVF